MVRRLEASWASALTWVEVIWIRRQRRFNNADLGEIGGGEFYRKLPWRLVAFFSGVYTGAGGYDGRSDHHSDKSQSNQEVMHCVFSPHVGG
jgi:hypothetical protein